MRRGIIAVALLGLAFGASLRVKAQDDAQEKHFPFDNGPDSIDVSAYPEAQQKNFLLFAKKCSKCHTLARPINAPFALPEEWQAYVTKMQKKKRSGVDADSAKRIIDFLAYDSSVRKKDLVAEKEKLKKEGKFEIKFDDGGTPAAKDGTPAGTK